MFAWRTSCVRFSSVPSPRSTFRPFFNSWDPCHENLAHSLDSCLAQFHLLVEINWLKVTLMKIASIIHEIRLRDLQNMIRMEAIFLSNNKCYEWNAMNGACHLMKLISSEHHANIKEMPNERIAQEINQTTLTDKRRKF